ncbi:MAG: minor capsid protein, partial [Propionibacteriaceae bacterium]|nr:minor capsid protein [Propionibacteriaceae bacterium]
ALGTNPKTVARHMLKRAKHGFEGGLRRAKTIARTEMMGATLAAALAWRQANADVLIGWRWTCEFSSRTCPSCLAMHGQLFSLDEFGPDDHQNGRCTATPVSKSWADLGIDLDEPADMFPDARAWFDAQDEATQVEIMGRTRLDALRSGRIGWDDIPVRRPNPDWRDSVVPAPVAGRRS